MSILDDWRRLPDLVAGLANGDLARPASGGMTARELVHHIVEANVVAASIVVAGLGSPGCTYDWSWMLPFGPWMANMRYGDKPIEPALALHRALVAYVAAQIDPLPDALDRFVMLRDAPDRELRRATIADVLQAEIEHARDHVADAAK